MHDLLKIQLFYLQFNNEANYKRSNSLFSPSFKGYICTFIQNNQDISEEYIPLDHAIYVYASVNQKKQI